MEGYGGKRKDKRGIGAKKYPGILESGEKVKAKIKKLRQIHEAVKKVKRGSLIYMGLIMMDLLCGGSDMR